MAEKHFYEQLEHTRSYLMPYFQQRIPQFAECAILEIGSAEGGFLHELQQNGMKVKGLELEAHRAAIAAEKNPHLVTIVGDITDPHIIQSINEKFDVIVMRDVIEHIPQRESIFKNLDALLNDRGYLYITFPPRFSAFAGHQQNGKSMLKFFPFLHLLPDIIIRFLGTLFKEKSDLIHSVIKNYKTGLSIRRFESLYKRAGFAVIEKQFFLSRPIFRVRFGMKIIRFPNVPILREWMATSCEVLLRKK